MSNNTNAPRIPVTVAKVAKARVKDLDPRITEAFTAAMAQDNRGLTGADITRAMMASGAVPTMSGDPADPKAVKANGLALRNNMRANGSRAKGNGGVYRATVREANIIAYAFLNDVVPTGGRFVKGVWQEDAPKAEATA